MSASRAPTARASAIPNLKCVTDPRTATLNASVGKAGADRAVVTKSLEEARKARAELDRGVAERKVADAEQAYRNSVNRSQLHSFTAMVYGVDPIDVTDAQVHAFLRIFVFVPALCAAFASTILALCAVSGAQDLHGRGRSRRGREPRGDALHARLDHRFHSPGDGPRRRPSPCANVTPTGEVIPLDRRTAPNIHIPPAANAGSRRMSIHASGTPENVVLAQSVNGRLRAETRITAARAFLFRAIGGGCFRGARRHRHRRAASYGYAYMNQFDSAAEKIAAAMQAALSDVTLKTKGEVTLTDNVLKLEGGPVRSSPSPTQAQLGKDAAPASKATVNTTFTVFKQVPYMDGQIVTGWNFRANEEVPFQQYCYFSRRTNEAKGQVEMKIDLAMDGKVLPQPQKSDVNLANPGLELRLERREVALRALRFSRISVVGGHPSPSRFGETRIGCSAEAEASQWMKPQQKADASCALPVPPITSPLRTSPPPSTRPSCWNGRFW